MGIPDRRKREREETRAKILNAARELFVEHGYDAVTMRKVAERIEYSPTAIYVHFRDKLSLMRELCDHDFLQLANSFQRLFRVEDPFERLRRCGMAYVQFAMEHPNQYRLMFMTPHPPEMDDSSSLERGNPQQDAYAMVVSLVRDGLEKGIFRPGLKDAELLAQTLWSGLHGIVALHLVMAKDKWVEWRPLRKRAELMVDALMNGLGRAER